MERARMSVTGWAVATVVVGIAISGCGNNSKTSSPSKSAATTAVSTSAGPPPDYSALLIQPNDLGGGYFRQAWHGHDVSADDDVEFGAGGKADLADGNDMV